MEPETNSSYKSKAFNGVLMSFTGISMDKEMELTNLVNEMGGKCTTEFDENVTHLIANTCDNQSPKYIAARRRRIPVILPVWIQDAYSNADPISDFLSEETIDIYRTPIFSGCEITISGFTSNERVEIGRMLELHGGKFTGQMIKNSCTHLIAANNSGEKFRRAKEWKSIYIVNEKWLRKSIEYKFRFDENDPVYSVEMSDSISILDNCMEPETYNSFKSKSFNGVFISFTGISKDKLMELTNLVNEMGGKCTTEFDENVTHLIANTCDNQSPKYIAARRRRIPVILPVWIQDAYSNADPISDFLSEENIDIYRTPIFSGCEITISGFTSNERVEMGRLLELHGGKFTGQMIKNSCTHLIAANNSGEKFRRAKEWKSIYIVNEKWLRKSIEYKVRLNESRFAFDREN